MPWTIADVEKHKQGLTDKQKEVWVAVANSSLKSCLAGGKEQGFCEGYAVRVANSKAVIEEDKDIHEADWDVDYINNLKDSCFAFIAAGGEKDDTGKTKPRTLRHFPFKDKDGNIDLPHLRNALARAPQSPFGDQAILKLKAAAKQMKVGEYSENWKGGEGYFTAQVQLTSLRENFGDKPNYKPNDEKKEIVIPLLVEGWGNAVDNNYYTPKAVTEAASYLQTRRKMYLNHPKIETDNRDLRDWAGSIQETWVETLSDGKKVAMGRVKILDNWLWERCKSVPDEIADSLIGRGKASKGIVNGRSGNIIESIEYVKSCDFVDYGGNVPFGMVYFVENDKDIIQKQEEKEMLITDITLGMLKESRPELVMEIEKVSSVSIQEKDKKIVELDTKLKEVEKQNIELKNTVDQCQVKEQLSKKKETVEKALKESKLPDIAKTEIFTGILMSCEEGKIIVEGKEKVVTVEEQIKKLIEDREVILGQSNPVKGMGGSKTRDY